MHFSAIALNCSLECILASNIPKMVSEPQIHEWLNIVLPLTCQICQWRLWFQPYNYFVFSEENSRQRRSFFEIYTRLRWQKCIVLTFDFVCVARLRFDNKHPQKYFLKPRSGSEMTRLHFLKIPVLQQLKKHQIKTCFDWKIKHEIMEKTYDTQLVLGLGFHLSFHPRLNSQHHYGSGRPSHHNPPQDFLLGPTVRNPPTSASDPSPSNNVRQMVRSSNKLFSSDSWKTERSSAFLLEHCSGRNCPFSEDFEPSTFHVKNWSFAHQCDGHTSKHHCTWKLVLMALVTLFGISSWLLPGSCPAPVVPNLKKKKLCRSFCSSSPTLVCSSTIWLFKCPLTMLFHVALCVKLRMMNVSKNSSNRNNDSILWEFVNLSRHMHSPTWKMKFWPINIFSKWQPGLVHIFENRTGRRPGVKDKQETKKIRHTQHSKMKKMEWEIGMGSKSSQSGKNINFIAGITVDLHERHHLRFSKIGGKRLLSDHKNWKLFLACFM